MLFRNYSVFILISTSLCVLSCTGKDTKPDEPKPDTDDGKVEVVDGKMRLYLSAEESQTRQALGIVPEVFNQYVLRVNGEELPISKDETGRFYADIETTENGTYNASLVMSGTSIWYGSSPYSDLKIPYSQFQGTTATDFKHFPMFASWSEADGNKLKFSDGFSVVKLTLKGSTSIVSVKVDGQGTKVGGNGSFLPSKGRINIAGGVDFAVLNCTRDGANTPILAAGTVFPVIVGAGDYPNGLAITIVDANHRVMHHTVPAGTLEPGAAVDVTLDWKPEEDIVWYEGFDNFVWGGNVMEGSKTYGFAPDAENVGIDGATNRTGTEYPFTVVLYDTKGSGFIQPNSWDSVSGFTVGSSHQMSASWVRSRGVSDWSYLFRCQEQQGYLSVATTGTARGILHTPPIGNIKGVANATVSCDFCFQNGIADDLLFQAVGGGRIKACRIDGVEYSLTTKNCYYESTSGTFILDHTKVSVPGSLAEKKTWHRLEVDLERASGGTSLYFATNKTDSRVHGFWIDNISVKKTGDCTAKPEGTIRFLYWNIQNGMWADQANNYDNFIKWVKTYDPDICVWCEASSIYYNNTKTSAPTSARFLPNGWGSLAARYGHAYSALGGKRDNYPQEITSKYPIKTVLKITDSDTSGKPISHGAAIQEITVNGRTLSFVTCHMWPQSYAYGVSSANQSASTAEHGGDYYRQFEMEYLMKTTVNNATYAGREWILVGDLNSRSRLDNGYYKYAVDNTLLITQDVVLNKTDLKDVIHEQYPDDFISSTYGNARIDFVYCSPALMSTVKNSFIVMDEWTNPTTSPYVESFKDPSDHRPIIVDFKL